MKIIACFVAIAGLSSCTIVRSPDGSWTATPDPKSVLILSDAAAQRIIESSGK